VATISNSTESFLLSNHRYLRSAGPDESPAGWLNRAMRCRLNGNDLAPVELCESMARQHPRYSPALFASYATRLASLLELAGRYDEARIERRRAHHYSLATPEMVDFLVSASEEYYRTGETYSAFSSALMAHRLMELMVLSSPELKTLRRRCLKVLVPAMEAVLRNPDTQKPAAAEIYTEIG
jgi:hypothetical protein